MNKLPSEAIGSLCGALGHLLGSGISTGDALYLLRDDEPGEELRITLGAMAAKADEGYPLPVLFREAGCFPDYVCTLLSIGTNAGKTEYVLNSLSAYYTARYQMERRLRSALLYPAMLLGALVAVIVVLLVWVLPIFDDVYAQLGSRLTGVAGALLALGGALGKALPYLCAVLVICLLCAAIGPVRRKVLALFTRWTDDKGAMADVNSARFLQSLALSLGSGMTAREAVSMAADLSVHEGGKFALRCEKCLALLDEGKSLGAALAGAKMLSAGDKRLLEAGTRAGRGDTVLERIAEERLGASQERLEAAVGRIEPVLVGIACLLIGAVLLSVMVPLMHIMEAMG